MHLFLGKTYELIEIKYGLETYSFNEFFRKIRIFPDKLFVNININKAGRGIFNGGSGKMMAVVNIYTRPENIFNRFYQPKDQVFSISLDVNFGEPGCEAEEVRGREYLV